MAAGEKPIDWGMGEALALGTLLGEGVRVRMSGQDVRRGTFSHRHAVLVDYDTGAEYTPLAHVAASGTSPGRVRDPGQRRCPRRARWASNTATAWTCPRGSSIWEAQFGDFVNGAQVIIDQFLVSSEAKWNRVSGLVMLLPHGMEGQGPEHSSGAARALPQHVRQRQHAGLQRHHAGPVLPPAAAAGAAPLPQAAHRDVPQEPAAPPGGGLAAVGAHARASSSTSSPTAAVDPRRRSTASCCARARSITTWLAAREVHARNNVAIIRIEQLYPLRQRGDPGESVRVPRRHPGHLGPGRGPQHGRLDLHEPGAARRCC